MVAAATRVMAKLLLSRPRPKHVVTLGLISLLLLVAVLWRDERPNEAIAASLPSAERRRTETGAAELSNMASRVGPARHIYFLKTHKCASTTVQRIVLTYAIRNNLSVALPTTSINSFYPRPFSTARAKRTCAHPRFDIMASHAVFSESSRRSMPADTVYAAIVRDPADQMESAYYYYLVGFCRTFPYKKFSFSRYLSTAIRQYGGNGPAKETWSSSLRFGCNMRQLRFLQLHDFGFDMSAPPTPLKVQATIKRLDALFDIVLIVERLDESLVLLRDLLGWSTADMVYLRSNFRVNSTAPKTAAAATAAPPLRMSNATRLAAYTWNWGDKMLYDHFRAKMDAAIAHNAAYVREQVSDFRRQQEAFHDRCVAGVTVRGPVRSGSSVKTGGYVLSNGRNASLSCRLAAMSELDLFRLMNEQQPKCKERRVARKP